MPDLNLLFDLLTKFSWLGNWLFFILAFTESAPFVGLFIPGATLISVGGFLAAQGLLNAWDIIIFATVGAIFGDLFSYFLGLWGGNWIKNKKIINQKLLKHGEDFFAEYGNKSVFFGRFFGPVRAVIPFIAGLAKMEQRPFIFWNIISAIAWAILNVFLGYFSGTLIGLIFKKWSGRLSIILIITLITVLIYWLTKKHGQNVIDSFRINSVKFTEAVSSYQWFKKLNRRYPFISEFFKESRYAEEKLFGGSIIFTSLILTYLLIILLDVF
ncbi:MAG: DedA family protein [Patescibacteria group bacterium]